MERIQLYPPENLKHVMEQEAKRKGVSMSQLSVDILMNHYGLAVPTENKKSLPEVIDKVIDEVKIFVKELKEKKAKDKDLDTTFDLLTASETFKNIHMVAEGKPSTTRATIGKVFVSKLGKDEFENVVIARTESGEVKKSVNRATLYELL